MGREMTEKNKAPSVHIPEEHQSAPKEHWADKEIRLAADEIRMTGWTPEPAADDFIHDLPIALGNAGDLKEIKRIAEKPTYTDFQNTHDSMILAQHPRVLEAMERLKDEVNTAKTPQEAIEKSCMLHELNERASKAQKWDGQERWEGEENEEMRYGLLLTPQQFHERLCRVIGESRILLSRHAVKTHPEAKSARVGLYVENKSLIVLPGMPPTRDEFSRVGTLQWPLGTEWMIMNFNEYGVPTTAKYLGWRTALLTMIRVRVLTEKEAHKAFPLGTGPAGAWYRQQLFEIRAERGGVH